MIAVGAVDDFMTDKPFVLEDAHRGLNGVEVWFRVGIFLKHLPDEERAPRPELTHDLALFFCKPVLLSHCN